MGIVGPERIDEINILQATYEAMRQAIAKLDPAPQVLLNDAVTIPGVAIRRVPIIKGDAKSVSIAAASILAKVTRDHMMEEYDKDYPSMVSRSIRIRNCGTYHGAERVLSDTDPQTDIYYQILCKLAGSRIR